MDDLVNSVNSCNKVVKALERHKSYNGNFG
jgi:hypothetical protein